MSLKVIDEGSSFVIAHAGSLVVTTFSDGGATVDALDRLDRFLELHIKAHKRYSTLTVVLGAKLKSPPNEVRVRSAALDDKTSAHAIGSAIAIETKGLAAIAARTFLVAHSFLSKHASPFQSFALRSRNRISACVARPERRCSRRQTARGRG